jgi:hypothetical protein
MKESAKIDKLQRKPKPFADQMLEIIDQIMERFCDSLGSFVSTAQLSALVGSVAPMR